MVRIEKSYNNRRTIWSEFTIQQKIHWHFHYQISLNTSLCGLWSRNGQFPYTLCLLLLLSTPWLSDVGLALPNSSTFWAGKSTGHHVGVLSEARGGLLTQLSANRPRYLPGDGPETLECGQPCKKRWSNRGHTRWRLKTCKALLWHYPLKQNKNKH